jgi:hypothetical protein
LSSSVTDSTPVPPRIERVYSMADLEWAFRHLASNQHVGKLVSVSGR